MKTATKAMRDSNIELLRILTMIGVVILHFNHPDVGGGFTYAAERPVNLAILNVLESIFICAVDLFVLISGYFMYKKTSSDILKPFTLISQVIIFSAGRYILSVLMNPENVFSISGFFNALLPTNYFVILYVALYFISPYINLILSNLSNKKRILMVCTVFALFSVYPILVDMIDYISHRDHMGLNSVGLHGDQNGYTIVNFVLVYIIGAFLGHYLKDKKINTAAALLVFLVNTAIIYGWSLFSSSIAWAYCNPLVIINAVTAFLLFKNMKIKNSKIINSLAKGSFTVFLLHDLLLVMVNTGSYAGKSTVLLIPVLLLTCLAIYLVCWIVYVVYNAISTPIFAWIAKILKFGKIECIDTNSHYSK